MSMHEDHGHDAHEAHAATESHHESEPKADAKAIKTQAAALRTMVLGAIAAICVLVVVGGGVLIYGAYKLGWRNPASSLLTHVLPLPVATVNGNPVTLAAYEDDIVTVKHYFAARKAEDPTAEDLPADDVLRSGVLDRLVQMEVLREEAARYNITVTDKEVEDELTSFQQSAGEGQDPAAEILKLYGWNMQQFKDKVMRPYLMQQKLAEAIGKDEALVKASEARANDVLDKVNAGGDFAELAKEYSMDTGTAQEGGELDWFDAGVMVPEFEEAAFALKKGETSGLVKTSYGFHIIRVEDVKKDKAGKVTSVKASHILIAGPNVQDYLNQKVMDAKVHKYVQFGTDADKDAAAAQ